VQLSGELIKYEFLMTKKKEQEKNISNIIISGMKLIFIKQQCYLQKK